MQSVVVRLITKGNVDRWDDLMNRHHHLGFRSIGGQSLRYVATLGNERLALVGWGSAALKCIARERFIGWDDATKPRLSVTQLRHNAARARRCAVSGCSCLLGRAALDGC